MYAGGLSVCGARVNPGLGGVGGNQAGPGVDLDEEREFVFENV